MKVRIVTSNNLIRHRDSEYRAAHFLEIQCTKSIIEFLKNSLSSAFQTLDFLQNLSVRLEFTHLFFNVFLEEKYITYTVESVNWHCNVTMFLNKIDETWHTGQRENGKLSFILII